MEKSNQCKPDQQLWSRDLKLVEMIQSATFVLMHETNQSSLYREIGKEK